MSNYAGMTFEEAQEQEKKDYCFSEPPPPISVEALISQLWVSVQDRLPTEKGRYLVYGQGCTVISIFYPKAPEPHFYFTDATHWMPLPEAPK